VLGFYLGWLGYYFRGVTLRVSRKTRTISSTYKFSKKQTLNLSDLSLVPQVEFSVQLFFACPQIFFIAPLSLPLIKFYSSLLERQRLSLGSDRVLGSDNGCLIVTRSCFDFVATFVFRHDLSLKSRDYMIQG